MIKKSIIILALFIIALAVLTIIFWDGNNSDLADKAIPENFNNYSNTTEGNNRRYQRLNLSNSIFNSFCIKRHNLETLNKVISIKWLSDFFKKVGELESIENICYGGGYVAYVKELRSGEYKDTFYILGVYNISEKSYLEFNPHFRGFISMGDPGCEPKVGNYPNGIPDVYFECLASSENRGEGPAFINENAKIIYGKYRYNTKTKKLI